MSYERFFLFFLQVLEETIALQHKLISIVLKEQLIY